MTALLHVLLGFAVGVPVGLLWRARRASLLAENNHWVGEEIEALKGADLDADVAAHRRERISGEQPAVELIEVEPFMADSGYRPPSAYAMDLSGEDVPDDAFYEPAEHLGQACGWSEDGTTVCGEPAEGWARWPDGEPDWFCATHLAWMREQAEEDESYPNEHGRTADGHDLHSLMDLRSQLNDWGGAVHETEDDGATTLPRSLPGPKVSD